MEELKLIANPHQLKSQKEDNYIVNNENIVKNITLDDFLKDKYREVYLSELNKKQISEIIDDYINELIDLRTINDIINSVIEKAIENSDKFDFCLPFD